MGKGFRQADVRRLEEIFNHDLPAPYAAEGSLLDHYRCLHMRVVDPQNPEAPVCNVSFDYNENQKKGTQPPILEVERIANEFVLLCREYELTRDQRAAEAARLKGAHEKRLKARADALKPAPSKEEVEVEVEEKTEMEA